MTFTATNSPNEKAIIDSLPQFTLAKGVPYSDTVRSVGIEDFRSACEYVWRLPFGRTSHPHNISLVIKEGRGTCGSKHALLAYLAREAKREDLHLMLCIYKKPPPNEPEIRNLFFQNGLSFIIEAHCYLSFHNHPFDFTRYPKSWNIEEGAIVHREAIHPLMTGNYKRTQHRRYITQYHGEDHAQDIIRIREQCIWILSSYGQNQDNSPSNH